MERSINNNDNNTDNNVGNIYYNPYAYVYVSCVQRLKYFMGGCT